MCSAGLLQCLATLSHQGCRKRTESRKAERRHRKWWQGGKWWLEEKKRWRRRRGCRGRGRQSLPWGEVQPGAVLRELSALFQASGLWLPALATTEDNSRRACLVMCLLLALFVCFLLLLLLFFPGSGCVWGREEGGDQHRVSQWQWPPGQALGCWNSSSGLVGIGVGLWMFLGEASMWAPRARWWLAQAQRWFASSSLSLSFSTLTGKN